MSGSTNMLSSQLDASTRLSWLSGLGTAAIPYNTPLHPLIHWLPLLMTVDDQPASWWLLPKPVVTSDHIPWRLLERMLMLPIRTI